MAPLPLFFSHLIWSVPSPCLLFLPVILPHSLSSLHPYFFYLCYLSHIVTIFISLFFSYIHSLYLYSQLCLPSSSPSPPVFLIAKSMLKVREQGVAGTASKHGYPLLPLPRNLCVCVCVSFSSLPTHKHTSFHLSHLNLC